MNGARQTGRFLLSCACGHDHFDRLTALKSLTFWPEDAVKEAIDKYHHAAQYLRSRHYLHHDGQLSLDQAIAVVQGVVVPNQFLLTTEILADDDDEEEEDIRQLIRIWNELSVRGPDYRYSLPILQRDTERLGAFAQSLVDCLRSSTEDPSLGPFDTDGTITKYGHSPIGNITWINTEDVCRRDFHLGSRLIKRLVDEHTPEVADTTYGWRMYLENALEKIDVSLRLLARTLSAVSAQALMEQWTFWAWRAYSGEKERQTLACYGHPVVLWSQEGLPSCRVVRVLSVPQFRDPQPNQAYNYRHPTERRGRGDSPYHWAA